MGALKAPRNLVINFAPSERQYELWNLLQPNRCPHCGGEIIQVPYGIDKQGHPTYKAQCKNCGSRDLPQIILGGGSAGGGKAVTLDSQIVTPTGIKLMKDIKEGDFISSPITGGAQKVIKLHPIEEHEYYRVTFIDGAQVECSEGHLWQCHISKKRTKRFLPDGTRLDERIMETKDMYQWYKNKEEKGINKEQYLIIPLTVPVKFAISTPANRSRILSPYVLGAMIGNGCMTKKQVEKHHLSFVTMDENVIERIKEAGYEPDYVTDSGKAKSYRFFSSKLEEDLEKAGVLGHQHDEKFIPNLYKFSTIEERKELMQGLMDTDGYVDDRGHMSYCTTSKQLADDVAFIVRSLGGKATITSKVGAYRNNYGELVECKTAYNVWIMTKFDPELVSTPRKKERARYDFNGGNSDLGRRITSIEYIGRKTGRCITVDEPGGLYLTNDFVVTHNSFLGSAWLVSSCIRFADIRAVVARKTLKMLKESTWNTIKTVVKLWGLKEGINYKINNLEGTMTFWNGSVIIMKEMVDLPSDPNFERFGSSEYTIAFVDEVSEISERAVEVLFSRLRWNVADTFAIPRMLLSTNPCLTWVRSRFVQDDDGNPVQCKEGEAYVPFSVFDNPNESFRIAYVSSLNKITDKATRERLIYGNWDFIDSNDMAAYWKFDGNIHIKDHLREKVYNPLKPLIISWDFNVSPFMSTLVFQIDYEKKNVYILEEILGKPEKKENNTPRLAKVIERKYVNEKHLGGLFITGDPAGLARSTQTEEGVNNFTIITSNIQNPILKPRVKLLRKQPPQVARLEFVNNILDGYDGWSVMIDGRCRRFVDDMVYQMKNSDGTKCKQKVNDPKTGLKFEKYGHLSDCFDYVLCLFLDGEWKHFNSVQNRIATVRTEVYGGFSF